MSSAIRQASLKIPNIFNTNLNSIFVLRSYSGQSKNVINIIAPAKINGSFNLSSVLRHSGIRFQSQTATQGIENNISSLQFKKRTIRKKKILDEEIKKPGIFNVIAFSTAEEYDLEKLMKGLKQQDLYETQLVDNNRNVVHAVAKYQLNKEPREIFFFNEGTVVLWNVEELEYSCVLSFLKEYEENSYSEHLIHSEMEVMNYMYEEGNTSTLDKNGDFVLACASENLTLDKYTFSNAIGLSVKLAIWEASLERYVDSIEIVTNDLKKGVVRVSREEVLRKHGELLALRHSINLGSDLLDTPDFYWENERLEALYVQVCSYFGISKRTRVMNEKINHCVELIELLSSNLSDKHHTRLEWMIIILIMVEVAFETIHYIDRFVTE